MKFEIAIYNSFVADAVARGESYKKLSDDWAEAHYIEFEAEDQDAARRRATQRYPVELGYVIQSIEAIEER